MSVNYDLHFVCDACSQEYFVKGNPILPPHWISVQLMVSNKDGFMLPHEEESPILHFCSQICFRDYSQSQDLRERILLADKIHQKEEEEEEEYFD